MKSGGKTSIIYYTNIIGIDPALYEATIVDGANGWQKIRYITLPALKSTIITMVLLSVGRSSAAGFMQSICGFLVVFAANFIVNKIDPDNSLF